MQSEPTKDAAPGSKKRRISWVAVGIIVFAIVVAVEGAWIDSIDKSDSSAPAPTASATATPVATPASP